MSAPAWPTTAEIILGNLGPRLPWRARVARALWWPILVRRYWVAGHSLRTACRFTQYAIWHEPRRG